MVKHVWSVLCERVSIDQFTNLVSFLSCVEGVTIRKLPINIAPLSFGSYWYKEEKKQKRFQIQLLFIYPNRTEKRLFEGEQVMTKSAHRFNIILSGLPIEQFGIHTFKLQMKVDAKWVVVSEIPFKVTLAKKKALSAKKIKGKKGIERENTNSPKE